MNELEKQLKVIGDLYRFDQMSFPAWTSRPKEELTKDEMGATFGWRETIYTALMHCEFQPDDRRSKI